MRKGSGGLWRREVGPLAVIPAQAGTQGFRLGFSTLWVPASAGMTIYQTGIASSFNAPRSSG
jgi:hypothetical protein